jgi:ribosomal protein S18 acetylase RimI-like enzyme/predicted double-glycine peptidase
MTDHPVMIRPAVQRDLNDLVALETIAFTTDRFTEEHIEYLLSRARATTFIAERQGRPVGAAYLLWRRNAGSGRLYNIVVDPEHQSKGIGSRLLSECETETVRRQYPALQLEVRPDNTRGIDFYQRHGYAVYKTTPDFYDDGTSAVRMRKTITLTVPDRVRHRIPYYAQTLGFTCGSACLMMVLKYFQPNAKYNRALEMNLWKEATLIFMTSGIGGTGPFGLALAAARRNLSARVLSSMEKAPFVHSVRKPHKKAVIRLLHDDMKHQALSLGVGSAAYDFSFDDIRSALLQGWIPIALISNYRLSGFREPHWVVISGFDNRSVYLLDPYERPQHRPSHRNREVDIEQAEFFRISRYGKDVYRCAILIGPERS